MGRGRENVVSVDQSALRTPFGHGREGKEGREGREWGKGRVWLTE